MVSLPTRKVGIIACSGEELAEGTVSRVATRLVLEKLRPGQTVTLCLPLFLAGDREERAFAKFYPTVAVDGCGKLCAAKATETYSAKPAAIVVVTEVAKRFPGLRAESRRNLGEGGMELARRVAEEIAAQVDRTLARPTGAGVMRLDISDIDETTRLDGANGNQVVQLDGSPSRRTITSGGCLCGLDPLPIKTLQVEGSLVGIAGLERIFEQVLASSNTVADGDLRNELLRLAKIYNYVPPGLESAYADALWKEFQSFRERGGAQR